jgi:hypothetical protein
LTKYFIIISLAFLIISCNILPVENYYIPKDFEGNVAIIYKKNGSKPNKTQNWNIPEDGILKTEHRFISGNYKINYYQKNISNTYDTLNYQFTKKDTTKNEIVFARILTFAKGNSNDIFTVNTFYVGKKKVEDLEKDRFFFEQKLEKMLLGD